MQLKNISYIQYIHIILRTFVCQFNIISFCHVMSCIYCPCSSSTNGGLFVLLYEWQMNNNYYKPFYIFLYICKFILSYLSKRPPFCCFCLLLIQTLHFFHFFLFLSCQWNTTLPIKMYHIKGLPKGITTSCCLLMWNVWRKCWVLLTET